MVQILPPAFLPSRSGRFRQTAAASEALDQHLKSAIADLRPAPAVGTSSSSPPEGHRMRGLERLTSLAQNALDDIDKQAGDAADRIVAAKERAASAVEGFANLAVSMEDKARLVEQALAQLTNNPPANETTGQATTPVPPPPVP